MDVFPVLERALGVQRGEFDGQVIQQDRKRDVGGTDSHESARVHPLAADLRQQRADRLRALRECALLRKYRPLVGTGEVKIHAPACA